MITVNRFTLANGLRVVHNYDPTTAMAVVDVLYNVGSRDENPELTGMAHLFEHLMFGGSVNIPDFDGALEAAGGMSNAWTSNDFTNFYDVLPAQNVETAFWLESDRMLSLAFSDKALEVQRSVVVEEFKQVCLNRPYGDLDHHLRSLFFRSHPYRYPVIGKEFSHIEKVTQDDVRAWFAAHYAPNNAVLSVSGNVEFDRIRKLAEKWFGDIPSRHIAPRLYADEPVPSEPRLKIVSGNVPQTAIVMAFPMGGYGSPDYIAADTITDILANGRSSRFYQRLLLPGVHFTEIDAYILGSEHPGMLMVNTRLCNNGMEAEQAAVDAINGELRRLVDGEVGQRELVSCVNRLESDRTFSRMSCLAKAQGMARCEIHGEDINDEIPRYRSLTPSVVRSVASTVLDPCHAVTLIYRPS